MAGKHQEANGCFWRHSCSGTGADWAASRKRNVVTGRLCGHSNKGIFRFLYCGNEHAPKPAPGNSRSFDAPKPNRRELCGHSPTIKYGLEGILLGNVVDDIFGLCGHVESTDFWKDYSESEVRDTRITWFDHFFPTLLLFYLATTPHTLQVLLLILVR